MLGKELAQWLGARVGEKVVVTTDFQVTPMGAVPQLKRFTVSGIFEAGYQDFERRLAVAQEWAGPYRPRTEIDLGFLALIRYSFFSLVRVCLGYLFSLAFTLFLTPLFARLFTRIGWGQFIRDDGP